MLAQERGWCICHTVMNASLQLEIVELQRKALRILHKSRWFVLQSRFCWVELLRWWHRNQRMLRKTKQKKRRSPG